MTNMVMHNPIFNIGGSFVEKESFIIAVEAVLKASSKLTDVNGVPLAQRLTYPRAVDGVLKILGALQRKVP